MNANIYCEKCKGGGKVEKWAACNECRKSAD